MMAETKGGSQGIAMTTRPASHSAHKQHQRHPLDRRTLRPVGHRREQKTGDHRRQKAEDHLMHMPLSRGIEKIRVTCSGKIKTQAGIATPANSAAPRKNGRNPYEKNEGVILNSGRKICARVEDDMAQPNIFFSLDDMACCLGR